MQSAKITTLEELMRLRNDPHGGHVCCPSIRDYSNPRHPRDIAALPGEVIWRLFQAGLYVHHERPLPDEHNATTY